MSKVEEEPHCRRPLFVLPFSPLLPRRAPKGGSEKGDPDKTCYVEVTLKLLGCEYLVLFLYARVRLL